MPASLLSLSDLAALELHRLHIPPNLLGYHYLLHAVERVAAEPLRIRGLTTVIYPEIARRYGTKSDAVARDIRTAVKICWERGGKKRLDEIFTYTLIQPPWPSELIAVVAARVARERT